MVSSIQYLQKQCVKKAPQEIYFEWNRIQCGISTSKKMFTDNIEKLLHDTAKILKIPMLFLALPEPMKLLNDLYKAYDFYMLRTA